MVCVSPLTDFKWEKISPTGLKLEFVVEAQTDELGKGAYTITRNTLLYSTYKSNLCALDAFAKISNVKSLISRRVNMLELTATVTNKGIWDRV